MKLVRVVIRVEVSVEPTELLGQMRLFELGQIFHVPDVIMVKVALQHPCPGTQPCERERLELKRIEIRVEERE